MSFFEDLLRQGHVAVYDLKGRHLPDLLCDKGSGSVNLFLKEGKNHQIQSEDINVQQYQRLSEIRDKYTKFTDIHLLDGEAIKLLLARYPLNASYAMVRMTPRISWLVGLPGLIRRLFSKQVRIRGIAHLKTGNSTKRWLVLEHLNFLSAGKSLSAEIGIQGFLDYLREEQVNYVVLRFYDKLPKLHESHGDLDILIADEDEEKIKRFLLDHPGDLHVDICNVSSHYYPPPLANEILNNSVDGPGGSRIPGPKEAFLSFAYHALYRRGFNAGIPSRLLGAESNPKSDNSYAEILNQMAIKLNLQTPLDMESLDEYLHKEGWRPPQGNLAVHTTRNEWVRRRFLPHHEHIEVDLGVLILKEKAVRLGLVDKVLKEVERQRFTVLYSKSLDEDGKRVAMANLRGGNWKSGSGDTTLDSTPAVAVVVLDTGPYSVFHAKNELALTRIRPLKVQLRNRFDDDDTSIVHSTNDTLEAWEYIEVCFPDQVKAIQEKINEMFNDFRASFGERFRFSVERQLAPQKLRQIPRRLLIRLLIN